MGAGAPRVIDEGLFSGDNEDFVRRIYDLHFDTVGDRPGGGGAGGEGTEDEEEASELYSWSQSLPSAAPDEEEW